MKKKLIIICVILVVLIISITGICIHLKKEEDKKILERNKQRYEEIKRDVHKEMERYWYIVWPTCTPSSTAQQGISDGELINNAGMDKEKFLDVDGENYCDTYTYATCVEKNKWEFETYIRCKDYEEEKFQDWR